MECTNPKGERSRLVRKVSDTDAQRARADGAADGASPAWPDARDLRPCGRDGFRRPQPGGVEEGLDGYLAVCRWQPRVVPILVLTGDGTEVHPKGNVEGRPRRHRDRAQRDGVAPDAGLSSRR